MIFKKSFGRFFWRFISFLSAGVLHRPVPVPDPDNPAGQSCHSTWIHGWYPVLPHTKVGETKGYSGKKYFKIERKKIDK